MRRFLTLLFATVLLVLASPLHAAQDVPYIPTVQFEDLVLKSEQPVVLQFGAEWCPFCRKVQPDLQDLRDRTQGMMRVYRVNVDNDRDLAAAYGVKTLPTFVYLDHGVERGRINGVPDKRELFGWAAKPYQD